MFKIHEFQAADPDDLTDDLEGDAWPAGEAYMYRPMM